MHPIFPVDEEGNIKIKPLGYVKSSTDKQTELLVDNECGKCLDGIEEFSHVVVLYWLHGINSYREGCHPQGREDVPYLGILATR